MMQKLIPIVKLQIVKDGDIPYGGKCLNDPKVAAGFARPLLENADREMVLVCGTDTKSKPVVLQIVAIGGRNNCLFEPAEILKVVLMANASGILIFHNHPSGQPEPSREDENCTERLKKAGDLLGITLMDHIIVGEAGEYYSFREHGKF